MSGHRPTAVLQAVVKSQSLAVCDSRRCHAHGPALVVLSRHQLLALCRRPACRR